MRASLPGTLESYYVQLTHARQCLLSALAILTYFYSPFASPVGPWVFFRSSPAKKCGSWSLGYERMVTPFVCQFRKPYTYAIVSTVVGLFEVRWWWYD